MRNFSVLAFVLVASVTACRDSNGGNNTTPDTPGSNGDTKIQDIQNDAMPEGTAVTLKGVIVTAIDNYGGKMGDFWVEEPGGGPFSGVHVYGAPLDQVAALALGDVVDITGAAKTEFALSTDTSGNKLTELEPVMGGTMAVTKVSAGTPITPDVVDALAIGQMTDYMARDAEWEKWEGVLVTVNNVSALSGDACVGTNCTDPTLRSIDITGDVLVESALAAMPMPKIARGDCLTGVTGVVDYFFNYQILPRTTAEIGTGGSACPPPENNATLCGDGVDNDGNGFSDCNDLTCVGAVSSCRTVTTISTIQTATTPPSGGVELQDVYVAAISFNKRNLWVQTNLQAGTNEGIYVLGPTGSNFTFARGSKVNVIGTVTEFNDKMGTGTLTEIKALSVTAGTAGGSMNIAPASVANGTATDALNMDAGGEPYESVLVRLANVKVTTLGVICSGGAVPPACNYGTGAATVGSTTVVTNSDIAILGPAGTCYASVDGMWSYDVYADKWVFLPLATTGTGTGTCP